MADKKVWLITGAGRGMGVDFVREALAAGHAVVATGRNPDAVAKALNPSKIRIAGEHPPLRRFIAGADAIATVETKIVGLQADIDSHRDLSVSLDFDELNPAGDG